MENHLPKTTPLGNDVLDVLDRDVALVHAFDSMTNASNARAPLMRPRTGWCSSGTPANDPTSASNSPAIKPPKNGTVTSSCRHFSSSRCSTGTENSSGAHGIRKASHIPPRAACARPGSGHLDDTAAAPREFSTSTETGSRQERTSSGTRRSGAPTPGSPRRCTTLGQAHSQRAPAASVPPFLMPRYSAPASSESCCARQAGRLAARTVRPPNRPRVCQRVRHRAGIAARAFVTPSTTARSESAGGVRVCQGGHVSWGIRCGRLSCSRSPSANDRPASEPQKRATAPTSSRRRGTCAVLGPDEGDHRCQPTHCTNSGSSAAAARSRSSVWPRRSCFVRA